MKGSATEINRTRHFSSLTTPHHANNRRYHIKNFFSRYSSVNNSQEAFYAILRVQGAKCCSSCILYPLSLGKYRISPDKIWRGWEWDGGVEGRFSGLTDFGERGLIRSKSFGWGVRVFYLSVQIRFSSEVWKAKRKNGSAFTV